MHSGLIEKTFIASAIVLAIRWVLTAARRARPATDSATGNRIYTYVWYLKVAFIWMLPSTALGGYFFVKQVNTNPSDLYGIILLGTPFLLFVFMTIYGLLEIFLTRLIVSDQSIISFSPWRGRREFRWDEIESVSYSAKVGGLTLKGPDGKKIRASVYLAGSGQLTEELRRRVPKERWIASGEGLLSISGDHI